MNHAGELISAYLDGELARPEIDRLQAHLATCGKCASELQEMQTVRSRGAIASPPRAACRADSGSRCRSGAASTKQGILGGRGRGGCRPRHRHRRHRHTIDAIGGSRGVEQSLRGRASLDPAFGPAKVVVPDLGDLLE